MASNIGIGKEAPKLVFVGDKWNNKNTYDKKKIQKDIFLDSAQMY